jgi:hypothetical protein
VYIQIITFKKPERIVTRAISEIVKILEYFEKLEIKSVADVHYAREMLDKHLLALEILIIVSMGATDNVQVLSVTI